MDFYYLGLKLTKCPKCGAEVSSPVKVWAFTQRKALKQGEESKVNMGIFECQSCKARFRAVLEVPVATTEEGSIKSMVERIKSIRGEFMQTLKSLREKIKTLETERADLMMEIEKLRKVAESRVVALESEVSMLREEVKSLRELLGYAEDGQR